MVLAVTEGTMDEDWILSAAIQSEKEGQPNSIRSIEGHLAVIDVCYHQTTLSHKMGVYLETTVPSIY